MFTRSRNKKKRRIGASAVEFAIVAPFIFMVVIGMMEIGRVMMSQHVLTMAAREAVRESVLLSATKNSVESTVGDYMSAIREDISGYTTTCTPVDPATAKSGDFVTVKISMPLKAISKWGGTWLGNDYKVESVAVMRKEGYE